jgi:hypothetical protein
MPHGILMPRGIRFAHMRSVPLLQESARHKQQLQSLESAKEAERKSTNALEAKVAEFEALQARACCTFLLLQRTTDDMARGVQRAA